MLQRLKPVAILLVERRVRQQVAGELLDGELVERQVLVEGLDHPVAVRPHLAVVVEVDAVRVGVAGDVEPVPAAMLAPVRRRQQAFDELLVSIGPTCRSRTLRPPPASAAGRSGRGSPAGRACGDRLPGWRQPRLLRASPGRTRSMGFRTQPGSPLAAAGASWRAMNDQCGWYSAPSAIQRLSVSFCSGFSVFLSPAAASPVGVRAGDPFDRSRSRPACPE